MRVLIRSLAAALLLIAGTTFAQGYPNKPIRLVVPFPAGGATDLLARSIAQRVGQQMGQSLVIDNKAGAGGSLGSNEVAKAPADGYTILIATSSTHSIGPHLNPNLPYKTETDFVPIVHVARTSRPRRDCSSPTFPTAVPRSRFPTWCRTRCSCCSTAWSRACRT
jgi:tripartite-type tricarboxylate transporter receptor subunit TctC